MVYDEFPAMHALMVMLILKLIRCFVFHSKCNSTRMKRTRAFHGMLGIMKSAAEKNHFTITINAMLETCAALFPQVIIIQKHSRANGKMLKLYFRERKTPHPNRNWDDLHICTDINWSQNNNNEMNKPPPTTTAPNYIFSIHSASICVRVCVYKPTKITVLMFSHKFLAMLA